MLLKDKVAIVTGGAVGIGKGIAVKFAEEGCSVVVVDIDESKGKKALDEVRIPGTDPIFLKCDITDNSQVRAMVDGTIGKYGRIDILVNNAGGFKKGGSGAIEEVTEEGWDWVIDLNLKGHFLVCKAVVPYMKERKYGKIVNLSSMGALSPPAPIIHYHAAKGGMLSLTRDLACELATYNITVNAVLPGPIRSEFYTEILKGVPDEEEFFASLGKRVPMQRVGTPEEIAGAVLFLASDLSSYVTGESICVGGGLPLPPE